MFKDKNKKNIIIWVIVIVVISVIVFLFMKNKNTRVGPSYEEKIQILNDLNNSPDNLSEEQKEIIIQDMQKDSKPVTDETRSNLLKGALDNQN